MPDDILTQNRLEHIAAALSERDKKILAQIRSCRYLTTRQIQRLLFTDAKNPVAGLKAANRCLNKLKEFGLTDALARRIGGVRAGSGASVWYLTDGGERLLRIDSGGARPRKRFFEPSPYFLAHTLAVAECFIQLTELCRGHDLRLVSTELEPECWRSYNHKGKIIALRPDLFAVTNCGEYEDRWFFEMDLDTEAPIRLVEKCRRYHDYYRSGFEQQRHEIFPLVVWIVPNASRKESLRTHIRDEFPKLRKIFIVITPDELETLIRQGIDGGALC